MKRRELFALIRANGVEVTGKNKQEKILLDGKVVRVSQHNEIDDKELSRLASALGRTKAALLANASLG
jgi:hypothetical protein